MKKHILAILAIVTLLVVVPVQSVSALNYKYAGYNKFSAYGYKADIYTPDSAPYLGDYYGTASWVSTANYSGNWVQTGWNYWEGGAYYSIGYADVYTEIVINNVGDADEFAATPFGHYHNNYDVEKVGSAWSIYINDELQTYDSSGSLPSVPADFGARLEVRDQDTTFTTGADTDFQNLSYKDSGGSWHLLTLFGSKTENSPYHITDVNQYYDFNTWGPQ